MSSKAAIPLRVQVLRRFNPMIMFVLRSFAHQLLSQRLLVLEYRGRKSGKSYSIPLAYTLHQGRPYCVTRTHTEWWRSASSGSVVIWFGGERREATAERLTADSEEGRAAFASFLARFPDTSKLLYKVRIGARGEPDPSDLAREIHNSVVVRLSVVPGIGA